MSKLQKFFFWVCFTVGSLFVITMVVGAILWGIYLGKAANNGLESIEKKGLKNTIMPVVEEVWEGSKDSLSINMNNSVQE